MVSSEAPTIEAKRQLITRVAESDLFRKSPRLREFLLYTGDCTLKNRLSEVREQVIAEKVFQRKGQDYDIQDSIVRAEARNLRKRLEKYFESEGWAESYLITMPKGGYALSFELRPDRTQGQVAVEPGALNTVEHLPDLDSDTPSTPERASPKTPGGLGKHVFAIVGIIGIAIAAVWIVRAYGPGAAASFVTPAAATLPFSTLFDNKQEVYIVTSDTAFLQISELSGRRFTLNDYLMRSYPDANRTLTPDLMQILNRAQFTDGSETTIAGLMMRRNARYLQRTYLRSGRQLGLADLKSHNIVLLGSPISNPWAGLYADQLNFEFEYDSNNAIRLRNRSPRQGESEVYPQAADSNHGYAQLVFLPNTSSDSGSVLLLAGTTGEATAAAGEFLLSESGLPKTLKAMGIDPAGPPRYFEIVLRATTFMGGATESQPIAYRLHPYVAR